MVSYEYVDGFNKWMVFSAMKKISKTVFKNSCLASLKAIEATGESVLITDHGKPTHVISAYREAGAAFTKLQGCVTKYVNPLEPAPVINKWGNK